MFELGIGYTRAYHVSAYSTMYWLVRPQRWKRRIIDALFPGKKIIPLKEQVPDEIDKGSCVLQWGTRVYAPPYADLLSLIDQHRVPIIKMEAGFYQSFELGASGEPPFSVCFDDLGVYYDARSSSRLEKLLQDYEVSAELLQRARDCIEFIVSNRLSKVNAEPDIGSAKLYGSKKARKRILVVGQVKDDESILKGVLGEPQSCNHLVRQARLDHPDAEIIYKVHPEVLTGYRPGDDPSEVSSISRVVDERCSVASALETIDCIYTISSFVGFEGLLRGIPVVCFGTPFYSGWGLTDDRDLPCARRTRSRTVEELFAIAAIIYPDYFDAKLFTPIPIESVLERLHFIKSVRRKTFLAKTTPQPNVSSLPKCSDVAFINKNPQMVTFVNDINAHLGLGIQVIGFNEPSDTFRKVLILNGQRAPIRAAIEHIPKEKRVYMEVGFFPQKAHVYLDQEGIHGHSSIRDVKLKVLSEEEKRELERFRRFFTRHNFVKLKHGVLSDFNPDNGRDCYREPFILLILQSERDTAFELCPYSCNQDIIEHVESCFPDQQILIRNHPNDDKHYQVKAQNQILPPGNTDLRHLLINAQYVIAGNSTVLLEALMHRKVCASLGTGFSTNHNVCLECHNDKNRLRKLSQWQPDWERVDQFLYILLQRQIAKDYWFDLREQDKLIAELIRVDVLRPDI